MGTYTKEIEKLYVAYFSRPADTLGLAYWEGMVQNSVAAGYDISAILTSIGRSFAASPEYTEQYGGKSAIDVVDKIYMNLFGRHAEPGGLLYWSLRIDSGDMTVNDAVRVISENAAGADAETFTNKVTVATNFTNAMDTSAEITAYTGSSANQLARTLLTSVTNNAATVSASQLQIDAALSEIVSFSKLESATVTQTLNNFTLGTATTTGTVLNLGSGVTFHSAVASTAVPGFSANSLSYSISSSGVLSFSGALSTGLTAAQEGFLINTILGNQLNTAVVFKTIVGGQTNSYVYANLAGADKFVALPGVDAAGGSSSGVAGGVNVVQIGQPPVVQEWW